MVGAALIDIQGTVQSIRGNTANGMVLNDTGNLNLVKFRFRDDSTIVGQPIGHIQIQETLKHVSILTPSRTAAGRNGVTVNKSLNQIGPLDTAERRDRILRALRLLATASPYRERRRSNPVADWHAAG